MCRNIAVIIKSSKVPIFGDIGVIWCKNNVQIRLRQKRFTIVVTVTKMDRKEVLSTEMKVNNEVPPPAYGQVQLGLQSVEYTTESAVESTPKIINTSNGARTNEPPSDVLIKVYESVALGNVPVNLNCPHCHSLIITRTEHVASGTTHCAAFTLFCLFWPCSCVPYLIDSCKDVHHSCPACGNHIGIYSDNCWEGNK